MSDTSDSQYPSVSNAAGGGLALFISEAPAAIAMYDRDLRIIAWSRQWAERYASGGRNLSGKMHHDVFPDLPAHLQDAHQRALAGEDVFCEEERVEYPDGRINWERWRIKPTIGPKGDIVGITEFSEVINRQKAVEARLKDSEIRLHLMIDALGIGTVDWDLKTGGGSVSDTFLRLLGLEKPDVPGDMDGWIEMLKPSDPKTFKDAWLGAKDPANDGFYKVKIEPVVAGAKRHMHLIGRVLFSDLDGQKTPSRFIGILIDETEYHDLQRSLVRAQGLETIGRISGIIAHDFNNLLSVIQANLELAAMRVSDMDANELLQSAIDAAAMGSDFNKKLLSLSGEMDGQAPVVQLDEHILRTWSMLERILNEDISLHFVPDGEGLCTQIDPAELDGAILNLVVNARDAQLDGGKIFIQTRSVNFNAETAARYAEGRPGHYLELSVSDTGTGMSPEDIQRAREPFYTSKAPTMGKGLGLTSVDATVSKANGFMAIESELGKGTEVSLFLPVVACPVAKPLQQDEMPFGNGQLILVVEDDAMVREATLKRLEALGYAVIEASGGAEALQLLADGEPVDLVFSDMVMPGEISGFDLLEAVRRHYPKTARLLTSGYASKRNMPQKPDGPLPELLRKPYSMAVLARAVERALTFPRG